MSDTPIIQVSPMGGLGNRMIQYLAALALAQRVPGARLAQIHLPEWGIQVAPVPEQGGRTEVVTAQDIDLDRLAAALNARTLSRVDIRSYAQRMDNLPPRQTARTAFPAPARSGTGPHELLINLRGGDILDGHHPDYVLVPVAFYAEIVDRTGLSPVFMGQLDDTPYLAALRARFPSAPFLPSEGALGDFARLLAACNVVPAISTFSWLGAWMSDAARVFLPVLGLFHPLQSPTTNLLPFEDPRYRFHLFPHHYAVPVGQVAEAHAAMRGLWRGMPATRLRMLLRNAVTLRERAAYLAAFDEAFYLARYPDIASAVAAGHMPSGRHHYEHYGLEEGREPLAIDRAWYCQAYPIAAVELGQGDAVDVVDHFIMIGRERGYRRAR